MPKPDVFWHEDILKRMYRKPVKSGFFGWPIKRYSMRYLVNVGYVKIFYDWDDGYTKAELTEVGRAHVENRRESAKSYLSS